MTAKELNMNIKRLYKQWKNDYGVDTTNWTNEDWNKFENNRNNLKKEFTRLYYADKEFNYMNKNSIKMLIRINVNLRAIPLHLFGIYSMDK